MLRPTAEKAARALGVVLMMSCAGAPGAPQPEQNGPNAAPLSPQQLDNLVAPIALYPDPLLGQVLAASTYPMEIAEAQQWLRDHPDWKGQKLMDEAKNQNWDPSVQALVAFPEVVNWLSQNISWTTQLGNAFLAQQPDVMAAVQRMRAQAQAKGALQSTPQQTVTTEEQNGQTAISIQPANPDVWYAPYYDPTYVWGSPMYGAYPPLVYPSFGTGVGFGWFPGVNLGLDFGGWGGWGWGGWGWTPNWYTGTIFADGSFFNRYGFRGYRGGYSGRNAWVHDPEHRLGVPYANRGVAGRFGGNAFGGNRALSPNPRFGGWQGQGFNGAVNRGQFVPQQRFGTPGFEQRGFTNNHGVFGGYHNGGMARAQSDRGFSAIGGGQRLAAPRGGGFGGASRGAGPPAGGGPHGGGRR
ncbi:MAG: DUF3300 domain-containing protein [Bryobacterales bacterium]|nr:DUF3300 domain-containing protein [Bryobacterales bacterium]MBV9401595.1 DUF3300 domain-containing protein [Bryobacterales bacterium]